MSSRTWSAPRSRAGRTIPSTPCMCATFRLRTRHQTRALDPPGSGSRNPAARSMWRYSLRRLAGAIPTLVVVMTVAFFMMRLAPGGPFDRDRMLTAEVEANIRKAYNLDEPLVVQYGIYLSKLIRGDLGPSFKYQDYTVVELIGNGFPVSFRIGITAIMLALLVGGAFGIFAALRQNSLIDHAVMAVAMIGITVPNFVMAPLMALIIGVYLRLLPAGGYGGGSL